MIQVPVSVEQFRAWRQELRAFGFPNTAEGFRLMMRCFVEVPAVREAVRTALPAIQYPAA